MASGAFQADARIRTADPFITSAVLRGTKPTFWSNLPSRAFQADARIRTADPFITSAVLRGTKPTFWSNLPSGAFQADARIRTATPSLRVLCCEAQNRVLEQPAERAFQADARIRTADPFITSEVLYQLSYVGARPILAGRRRGSRAPGEARTRVFRTTGELSLSGLKPPVQAPARLETASSM